MLKFFNDKTSATVTATIQDTAENMETLIGRGAGVYGPLLQQATKTQITDYDGENLADLGANGLVEGGEYGDPTLELLIGADTTISHDEAAKLLAIDTIVLSQDDADVSLSATSFSSGTSTTHFRELAGITSSSNNTTLTFADDVGETGSTFD